MQEVKDLVAPDDGKLMSFEELGARYDIPHKHFIKYLQVRNFNRFSQNQSLSNPPLSVLDRCNAKGCIGKGTISNIDNILTDQSYESSESKLNVWRDKTYFLRGLGEKHVLIHRYKQSILGLNYYNIIG